ncbi:B-cell differentiation antigen CD72-like [Eublepharis macularius]|uniref:B-cell differentiation antigen CD72-like n=1 Tax=Eublepharis macularius TaxID=481883 RepID=A0AA97L4T0_EUBMA|nr:B-cell differentiation antigen CD72-like [Eublepharis macularius]
MIRLGVKRVLARMCPRARRGAGKGSPGVQEGGLPRAPRRSGRRSGRPSLVGVKYRRIRRPAAAKSPVGAAALGRERRGKGRRPVGRGRREAQPGRGGRPRLESPAAGARARARAGEACAAGNPFRSSRVAGGPPRAGLGAGMAEAVTYADLRFAKGAPRKSRPPADGPAASPADDGEGELTYENCPPARTRPQQPPRAPGPGRRRRGRVPLLALLGSCLFLLATCLALGVRYRQVSGELQRASQRHAAESGALGQRIGSREEELERSLGQLDQARAELSATRLALWESWRAGNGTQRRLEEELTLLQRGKEEATRQLEEARRVLKQVASCQKNHCCPTGWKLFSEKCLWVSTAWKTWEGSKRECESQSSQLLMLKPRDAGNRHDAAAIMVRCN